VVVSAIALDVVLDALADGGLRIKFKKGRGVGEGGGVVFRGCGSAGQGRRVCLVRRAASQKHLHSYP